MSTSEPFPTLAGPVSTGSSNDYSDIASIASTGWYTPGSVSLTSPLDDRSIQRCRCQKAVLIIPQYAYQEPYMTAYPTSTMEPQQWSSSMNRLSIPDQSVHQGYTMLPPQYQYTHLPGQVKDPSRPRSSPSTFGPGPESISWPMANGLGIWATAGGHPTPPTTSTFPPSVFQTYAAEDAYAQSTPEIKQPIPKRPFPTIAPNPEQVAAQKRKRDEEDQQESSLLSSSKKRKRTSSVASADLSEDDRFLVQLKEDESLPWKDIANRFHTDKGKNFQVAALQMRYKRLREKFRVWMDEDVKALRQAHEYWEKYKWEIIAQRVRPVVSPNIILLYQC